MVKYTFIFPIFALTPLLFISGCGSAPTRLTQVDYRDNQHRQHGGEQLPPRPLRPATAREQAEYESLELAHYRDPSQPLITKLNSFLKRYPESSLVPSIENLLGLVYLKLANSSQATQHFKNALALSKDIPQLPYLFYNLAAAHYQNHLWEEGLKTLEHSPQAPLPLQVKMRTLEAQLLNQLENKTESVKKLLATAELSQELHEAERINTLKNLELLLNAWIKKIQDASLIQQWVQAYPNSPFFNTLLLAKARIEIAAFQKASAEADLKVILGHRPSAVEEAEAKDLLLTLQTGEQVEDHTVGVLLPMSGKFAKFGQKALQAIQLALGVFENDGKMHTPAHRLTVIVEDAGENPETTLKALNALVIKHRVGAVLGPLLTRGIDQIANRAEELRVPLLTFSRRAPANHEQMKYVISANVTQKDQTREIAKFAMENLQIKRFALMFSGDKFGTESAYDFWETIENAGKEIHGIESYKIDESDFRESIDKLTGLYYSGARASELEALSNERKLKEVKRKTRNNQQFFKLKPIVDFEAVFIPDDSRIAGQIFPTFDYRDIDQMKFLGTASWNSEDFIARTQGYSQNAYFADSFFLEMNDPLAQQFIENYQTTFFEVPTSLEAAAYDAANLLEASTQSSTHLSRDAILENLKRIKNFQGASGVLSYQNQAFYRPLKILTVRNGKIIEVDKNSVFPVPEHALAFSPSFQNQANEKDK